MRLLIGIFKTIMRLIQALVVQIYRLLKLLRVRVLALYLIVCGIVQLIWAPFSSSWGQVYFWLGFTVCCILTFVAWDAVFREKNREGKDAKKPDKEPPQAEDGTERENDAKSRRKAKREAKREARRRKKEEKRKKEIPVRRENGTVYYEVEGKPGYFFAEFGDRYELYKKQGMDIVYVRTDYKEPKN